MIVLAHELLAHTPAPSVEEIRQTLAANLCMCTGYVNIVRAVARAAGSPAP
jgi:carbon-monoxide dehydrogenase small subunit